MSEEIQAARAKVRAEQRAKQAEAKIGNKNAAKDETIVVQSGQPLNDDSTEDDEPVVARAEPKPKLAKSRELVAENNASTEPKELSP